MNLSTGRIVGIVIALVVLFVLGFVIGWVAAPSDSDSSTSTTFVECNISKSVTEKRKEEMKKKDEYHKKLFEFMNAKEIGKNLRLVTSKD